MRILKFPASFSQKKTSPLDHFGQSGEGGADTWTEVLRKAAVIFHKDGGSLQTFYATRVASLGSIDFLSSFYMSTKDVYFNLRRG